MNQFLNRESRRSKNKNETEKKTSEDSSAAVAVLESSVTGVMYTINSEPNRTTPELKTDRIAASPSPFACPTCQSLEVWLPRAPGVNAENPTHWRCWTCKPPPNRTLIARRRGPSVDAAQAMEADRVANGPLRSSDAPKTIVVAEQSPTCADCLGSWIVEIPNGVEVMRKCFTCGAKIEPGVIVEYRERSHGRWKNPFWRHYEDRRQVREQQAV